MLAAGDGGTQFRPAEADVAQQVVVELHQVGVGTPLFRMPLHGRDEVEHFGFLRKKATHSGAGCSGLRLVGGPPTTRGLNRVCSGVSGEEGCPGGHSTRLVRF